MPEERNGPDSLSHLDESGAARMVDVGEKEVTARKARAEAWVSMSSETFELITSGSLPKGDVFATARIAGINAAKRTAELIPLCHPIRLDSVEVDFHIDEGPSRVRVDALARATDRTGVEMEALVAAGIAALTIYDMCKAVERGVEITSLRLVYKSGGKSGTWNREG
ncbi:MAG: cyclic pyranopterin monophosphate synthase MoaC [Actinobacteria bacterium]|nr:cyclic pyranopterin monophosphate synthase MoaC [Actinomycetota bacterium]MCG2818384.1 cyclic pyranopterin monophosphate synthase MoaC [Actinomycetes bacterium]MBU4179167.1 cyclic pyranopterin monophosphate synthase MoaC [Actinomycetota bacterium]MBU4219991.1 cyclic pyranopterin monophosphate synthase MoaC [Actinomycetota bacterium]MBU4358337.1 cyclic pyranopterin monophosphate synthase MoaC [Actinomycetota bacterium]